MAEKKGKRRGPYTNHENVHELSKMGDKLLCSPHSLTQFPAMPTLDDNTGLKPSSSLLGVIYST